MKKKKILYSLLSILIAFSLILVGVYFVKQNDDLPSNNEVKKPVIKEDVIPEESSLNDVQISLISTYTSPYKNIQIEGNKLIDGSYANRTVFVFAVTGMENLNTCFKSLKIYKDESELPCNMFARQYNKDEVLVFATCDNVINTENMKFSMVIMDPKIGDKMTFSRELSEHTVITPEIVTAGDLLQTSETGFWYRLPNGDVNNKVAKNGDNGLYYEYTRALKFYTFGENHDIDVNDLVLSLDIPYEYDCSITVSEKNKNEFIEYKKENTTSEKQLNISFKIYTDNMDDKINERIIETLDESFFTYKNQKIYISDGTPKTEHYN